MSDNLISRQHVTYTIDKYISGFDAIDANFLDGLKTAKKLIKELPSAQPEHTETHACENQRTGTHGWIPVTERQPYHELAIVQFSDGNFDLLQFPTAYRWKDIVAWMPLPEPYKEGQDGTRD